MSKTVFDILPSELKKILETVAKRAYELQKRYGSLQKAGRPLFESLEEVAVIWYAIVNSSQSEVARILGVTNQTMWNFIKSIRERSLVTIYNTARGAAEKIEVSEERLKQIIDEMMSPKAKRYLKDVVDSETIQSFIKNPVKIQKSSRHGRFYTKTQVINVISAFNEIASYINHHLDELRARWGRDIPSNPDLWSDADAEVISSVIDAICISKHSDEISRENCRGVMRMLVRRVPRFRSWFEGEIGSVKRRSRRIPTTVFYKEYLELKKHLLSTNSQEHRALWCIIALHITSGAREGWAGIANAIERMRAQGANIPPNLKPGELDLDDDLVNTSLIGMKWSKAIIRGGRVEAILIWEEKTKKEWTLQYVGWLDPDLEKCLIDAYNYAQKNNIKSIIKSILLSHGLDDNWTVHKFRKWYTTHLRKTISKILNKRIIPHRLRSAHISIAAELRLPLEYVLQDVGFGVGWEDLTTATHFYLRISRDLIEEYLRNAEEIKRRLAA